MNIIKIPLYAKAALIFIAGYAFVYLLYIARDIAVPLVYATVIAVLLNPFVNFLMNRRFGKILSITIAVSFVFIVMAGLIYFISVEASMFTDTYPELKLKLHSTGKQLTHWASHYFNIKTEKINGWILSAQVSALSDASGATKRTLLNISGILFILVLLPVYLFMILFYKTLLLEFIRQIFKSIHHVAVAEVLDKTKGVIQGYLTGLLIEALVVAILNSAGLLILGIDYAIILGIMGALLNVIPYIGGVIAIALPMIIAFVTKDSVTYPLMVLGIYIVIQFIDNHYIIPSVVASKVKLNALVSMVVVLIGGALWGLPGMFLS
ncbi:MAG: AI-2E family transporter, partial [Bacteroidia bacterium]